ncbi:MAG: glycosyltransferase [Planctomycetaceae bacterium]|nr:glycosyltransferase [Planctomycetaceae bacterium]
MEKETRTLETLQLSEGITVLGYWKPGLAFKQTLHEKTELRRLRTLRHTRFGNWLVGLSPITRYPVLLLSFPEYCLKAFFISLWNRPQFIACHNLILLPLAAIIKVLCRSRLVYVPHELETHRTGLVGPLKTVSKISEKLFIRFVDSTVVVCDPIARWYESAYRIPKVHVVPNVPYHPCPGNLFPRTNLLREHFSIPENDLICIYQGLVSKGRGVEDLLDLFAELPPHLHLVVMGYGELTELVKSKSHEHPNIHFKEAVPVGEILAWTSSADVGLFFNSKSMTLSYQYSLPNKFFEYAIGGLFIVISDNFVEQCRYLHEHQLGMAVTPKLESLKQTLLSLSKSQVAESVSRSAEFRRTIGWQSFAEVYRYAYTGDE